MTSRPGWMTGMLLLAFAASAFAQSPPRPKPDAAPPAKMATVESRYYVIHSDLPADDLREVILRVDCMAEEYIERTRGFAGKINRKFDFHIFTNPGDYTAAGGLPGSAGVFNGRRLMAIAQKNEKTTWHVIQHEGFHQFVFNVIGGRIPIWMNEGLAEYFGEGIFTGDALIVGVIPPGRLKRLQKGIAEGKLRTIPEMMDLTMNDWNGRLSIDNYDQAWSMVQFLAHADDGKYQKGLGNFINAMSRGAPWQKAWGDSFGDTAGFERRWTDYWTALEGNPTREIYAQAAVATITSFLGRATSQKQSFATYDEFAKAAKAEGAIKNHKDDWLPPDLLTGAIADARRLEITPVFETSDDGKSKQVAAELPDGTRVIGSFRLGSGGRVEKVWTTFDTLARSIAQAKKMLAEGKKDTAKTFLLKAMREFPRSPRTDEAKALVASIK